MLFKVLITCEQIRCPKPPPRNAFCDVYFVHCGISQEFLPHSRYLIHIWWRNKPCEVCQQRWNQEEVRVWRETSNLSKIPQLVQGQLGTGTQATGRSCLQAAGSPVSPLPVFIECLTIFFSFLWSAYLELFLPCLSVDVCKFRQITFGVLIFTHTWFPIFTAYVPYTSVKESGLHVCKL